MFLNYQPHLYERDRRKEREERNARLDAILDNSSIASPAHRNNRRQSIDSATTSNESVSRFSNSRNNIRRSSLTPTSLTSPSDFEHQPSSKQDITLTELPSPSSSLHSNGLFHLFHLRRNKSSGHGKYLQNKVLQETTMEKSNSRVSRSSERKSNLYNKNERKDHSLPRWGGRDAEDQANQLAHNPAKDDRDDVIVERSSSSSSSSSHSHFNFAKKAQQRPKMSKRPTTASDRTLQRTEMGTLQRKGASRSEQDLLHPTSLADERAGNLVNFDDDDSQEILRTGEPIFNEKSMAGLCISISSNAAAKDADDLHSTVDLSDFPLPVRLGVIAADVYIQHEDSDLFSSSAPSSFGFPNSKKPDSISLHWNVTASRQHQYVEGYYLCTPPPQRAQRKAIRKINKSIATTSPSSPTPQTPTRQRTISSSHSLLGQSVALKDSPNNAISLSAVSPVTFGQSLPFAAMYRNGPFMIAHNMQSNTERSNAVANDLTEQVEDRQKWRLEDYFIIENDRRPGRFGFAQRKRHAYSPEEAPYPFVYGSDAIFAENLIHAHTENMFEDLYHSSNQPPKRVLDIGCGTGQWILQMAKRWPETEFIGIDLVPIQMPVKCIRKDVKKRVSWIVANVLQGLPFPDQSFDYVHIQFLNNGVPEQKWSSLLDEVNRVLSPSGNLFILESDSIFFCPAKQILANGISEVEEWLIENQSIPLMDSKQKSENNQNQRDRILDSLWQKMHERSGIGLKPTSFLPNLLAKMKYAQQINQIGPKHTPIFAHSYSKRVKKHTEDGYFKRNSNPINYSITDATRNQVNNLDIWRAIILIAESQKIASAKFALFQEAITLRKEESRKEEERAAMQEARTSFSIPMSPSFPSSPAPIYFESLEKGKANIATEANESCTFDLSSDKAISERWQDFARFELDIDEWQAEIQARANIDHLLTMQLPWSKKAEDFDRWHLKESRQNLLYHLQPSADNISVKLTSDTVNFNSQSAGENEGNSPSSLTIDSTSSSQVIFPTSSDGSSEAVSPIQDNFWQDRTRSANGIEEEMLVQKHEEEHLANPLVQSTRIEQPHPNQSNEKTIMPMIVANNVESPNLDTPMPISQPSTQVESILAMRSVLFLSVRKGEPGQVDSSLKV